MDGADANHSRFDGQDRKRCARCRECDRGLACRPRIDRDRTMHKRAGRWVALAIALALVGGCVDGPPVRPPSTPYKGDAIWNVSRASRVPSVDAPISAGIATASE
jgi:hypothetical protein